MGGASGRAHRAGRGGGSLRAGTHSAGSLAFDDPRAIRSRRDLDLINRVMGQDRIMARALRTLPPPRLLADLGGGDGRFLLSVARRLPWRDVKLLILDRQNIVGRETQAAF